MPENTEPAKGLDRLMRLGLFCVAAMCVLGGLSRAFGFCQFDETAMKFFGVGAAVLVLHQFTKIKLPGVELERVREAAREEARAQAEQSVAPISKRVDLIETQSPLPGRTLAPHAAGMTAAPIAAIADRDTARPREEGAAASEGSEDADGWDGDPNAGRFGRSPRSNGRELSATIEPAVDRRSTACDVTLTVTSTDASRPLTGEVVFHLHPTFGRWKRWPKIAKDGKASISFTSWGTFTIGAEADGGSTRLELNLADVPGGTRSFYRN